jgi:hypothetical protein
MNEETDLTTEVADLFRYLGNIEFILLEMRAQVESLEAEKLKTIRRIYQLKDAAQELGSQEMQHASESMGTDQ